MTPPALFPGSRRAQRRPLRRDDSAVVDLPLKLLITAVVLAITVPAGFKALQKYGRDGAEREAAASLAKLETVGHQVLSAGTGTSVRVDLDFSGSSVASIEYARAGAALDAELSKGAILSFKVTGRPEFTRVTDPNIYFMHRGGEAAQFVRGTYKVQLTHETIVLDGRDVHYAQISFLQS